LHRAVFLLCLIQVYLEAGLHLKIGARIIVLTLSLFIVCIAGLSYFSYNAASRLLTLSAYREADSLAASSASIAEARLFRVVDSAESLADAFVAIAAAGTPDRAEFDSIMKLSLEKRPDLLSSLEYGNQIPSTAGTRRM
jgi:hypothetical protein